MLHFVLEPNSSGGKPNYPFIKPKDPNTIYYSQRDRTIVLPCKIENADATISLHKHENVCNFKTLRLELNWFT